ncbi:unnamed protein product [Caenorhabditis nigoni]
MAYTSIRSTHSNISRGVRPESGRLHRRYPCVADFSIKFMSKASYSTWKSVSSLLISTALSWIYNEF